MDTEDARNLILVRSNKQSIRWQKDDGKPLYFAVTSTDRYGNESKPTQQDGCPPLDKTQPEGAARLLETDGEYVILPLATALTDYKYLLVKNQHGQTVYITDNKKDRIGTRRIGIGIFTVKSVTSKGIEHTLGYFKKRTEQKK